jgi:hypothetical protein
MRDYPALTVRVPPETRRLLRALCVRRGVPTWIMIRQLILCFVRDLPPYERRRVMRLTRLVHSSGSLKPTRTLE